MKAVVGIGVVVAVIAWVVFRLGRRYGRLYAPEHLVELGGQMRLLWKTPVDTIASAAETPAHFVTAAGLIVVLTRQARDAETDHQLSLSLGQELLAMGAACTLLAFALDGVDPRKITVSRAGVVTLAAFTLTAAEMESVASAPGAIDATGARDRFRRAMEARRHVAFLGRLET